MASAQPERIQAHVFHCHTEAREITGLEQVMRYRVRESEGSSSAYLPGMPE
jgi:hypothetical protein